MAQFRARIQGNRGEAARLGTKRSGIFGNIAGWNAGVTVEGRFSESEGKDQFQIYATPGNAYGINNIGDGAFIGTVTEGGKFEPSPALRERIVKEWAESVKAAA